MKFDNYLKIDEAVRYSDRKIDDIVEEALMDFWARVAELVPEAESGDLDPSITNKVNTVLHQAVKSWIAFNTVGTKKKKK